MLERARAWRSRFRCCEAAPASLRNQGGGLPWPPKVRPTVPETILMAEADRG
jgi:hypothetical protein